MAVNDPSDDEVRAALRAHVARSGPGRRRPAPAPEDFVLTRLPLLEATVTRRVEHRTERVEARPGTVDLSHLPTYDVLAEHKLGPHETPPEGPLDLVRRGSPHLRACDCGNGRRPCADCGGKRYRPCEPAVVCAVCEGISACAQPLKHGGTPDAPRGALKPGRTGGAAAADRRVTCEACRTPDSACPGCRGWGKVRCTDCKGSGRVPCAPCGRKGTVTCATCEGRASLTFWTAGRIEWTREPDVVAPPVPRPRRVASVLDTAGWREDRLDGYAPLPDDLSPVHRDAVQRHLGRRGNEKDREVVVRRLDVVRAELPVLRHREFYVFRGADGRVRVEDRLSEAGRFRFTAVTVAALAVVGLVLFLVAR